MSNPVGSSLALTSIADGAQIVAADHRNNYSAIQTEVNDLVACLSGGVAGQVLGAADSSHTAWVNPPGYEIGYDQITAPVTVTSTTEASGTAVISAAAHTFDGGVVVAEFFSPLILPATAAAAQVVVCLFEGATELGQLCDVKNPAAASGGAPGVGRLRFTPTAGAHTYTVTAFESGGNGIVEAGAGGTSALVPAYIRFVKV